MSALQHPLTIADERTLRRAFLRRLAHLLHQRAHHGREFNEWGARVMDEMIVRSFADCAAMGARVEARFVLEAYQCR